MKIKAKLNKLENDLYSKSKPDLPINKNEILKEAIEIAAKIGDWEKFCELSIYNNEWEKAIMAAPYVSVKYWQDLILRYSEKKENKSKKIDNFISFLSNKSEPLVTEFTNEGNYDDAKLIYITRDNQEKILSSESNIKNYNRNNVEKRIQNLPEEDNLFKIIDLISKDYIINGLPILASCNYISVNNIKKGIQTLFRTNELEISYLIMDITNEKLFEKEILFGLVLKEIRRNRK